jgi:hypothetical protein
MDLTIDLATARAACHESVTAFLRAVDGFDEMALLGSSRCHGWTRLDVVVHVLGGWQEMLGGFVSPVDGDPTVDAASYWPVFAEEEAGDPLVTLMAQRRRTGSYSRPGSARDHLHDVADAVLRGIASIADGRYLWQRQVFTAGDFLAIWAVEDAVHHLDLLTEEPVPGSALELARATIEALAGPFPESWGPEDVVLVGAGRRPVPDGTGTLAARLPALG